MASESSSSESVGKEYVKWHSPNIGRDMEINIWGPDSAKHAVVVFPSSEGKFYQWEDEGMVNAIWHLIEGKQYQLFCVDSIDSESFFCGWKRAEDKARRHIDYERYIMEEVVPFIKKRGKADRKLGAHGVSWGGYHCTNVLLKHDAFDFAISMSGVLSLPDVLGTDFVNDDIYFNDPCMYLPNLNSEEALNKLRQKRLIVALGGGSWEEESRRDSRFIADTMRAKGADVWYDEWGPDMHHDWPTWRAMAPHHFGKMLDWLN